TAQNRLASPASGATVSTPPPALPASLGSQSFVASTYRQSRSPANARIMSSDPAATIDEANAQPRRPTPKAGYATPRSTPHPSPRHAPIVAAPEPVATGDVPTPARSRANGTGAQCLPRERSSPPVDAVVGPEQALRGGRQRANTVCIERDREDAADEHRRGF